MQTQSVWMCVCVRGCVCVCCEQGFPRPAPGRPHWSTISTSAHCNTSSEGSCSLIVMLSTASVFYIFLMLIHFSCILLTFCPPWLGSHVPAPPLLYLPAPASDQCQPARAFTSLIHQSALRPS